MTEAFRELAEELRGVLVAERRAIATLDHEKLTWLAAQKQRVAELLASQPADIAHKPILAALQVEARANAMLAAAATEAVRALLGRESTGYDRRARWLTAAPGRTLATY